MKFTATIKKAFPEISGTSQSGKAWRRRTYVAVYDKSNEQYPKEVLFDVLGDKIDSLNIQQGGEYELEIDFNVKEWNGKHFLQASCWKATFLTPSPQSAADLYAAAGMPPRQKPQPQAADDDLPF